MKQLKIPKMEEFPETAFQAIERLVALPGDTVTVKNLHHILGKAIFPGGPPRNLGQSWVRREFKRGGKYDKYIGDKEDTEILVYKEGTRYQIKKPLAALIVVDIIRLAMKSVELFEQKRVVAEKDTP